jgi:hypothetical protein
VNSVSRPRTWNPRGWHATLTRGNAAIFPIIGTLARSHSAQSPQEPEVRGTSQLVGCADSPRLDGTGLYLSDRLRSEMRADLI